MDTSFLNNRALNYFILFKVIDNKTRNCYIMTILTLSHADLEYNDM